MIIYELLDRALRLACVPNKKYDECFIDFMKRIASSELGLPVKMK